MGACKSKSNYYLNEDLSRNNIEQPPKPNNHISNHDFVIFGYLRQIYEGRYDLLIPLDIKSIVAAYCTMSQCCILTKYGQQISTAISPECLEYKDAEELSRVFKSSLVEYAADDIRPESINMILALFVATHKDHHLCLKRLLSLQKWENPVINYKRYRPKFENKSISLIGMACKNDSKKCMMELMKHRSK